MMKSTWNSGVKSHARRLTGSAPGCAGRSGGWGEGEIGCAGRVGTAAGRAGRHEGDERQHEQDWADPARVERSRVTRARPR